MSPELRSVEEARAAVLGAIPGPLAEETVPTARAFGRVLAEDVHAAVSLPPWPNSAMDGYALRAADIVAATEGTPVVLSVAGEVAAGVAPTARVTVGTAIRIATGARMPDGADAVVQVELTTPLGTDREPLGPRGREAAGPLPAACAVHAAVPTGGNVRAAGSDLRAGTPLAASGDRLRPAAIALIAGAGVPEVRVRRRPRIAVLATGDEVRGPGAPLGDAGIPDANGPGLRALVTAAGAEPVDLGIAPDRLDDVIERLRRGVTEADAVVVSGGVSVGPYDVVKLAFEAVGRVDLWRVAVQPGKPFAFGTASMSEGAQVGDDRGAAGRGRQVLLFGLPGNPVSGFVTFELFVRPAIRALAGERRLVPAIDRGVLLDATHKSEGRRAFLRVVAERDDAGLAVRDAGGAVRLRLAGGQGSHVMSALAVAEALAIVPEALAEVPAGTPVGLWWLDGGAEER
jgi:molybdopterin molybdotransferase